MRVCSLPRETLNCLSCWEKVSVGIDTEKITNSDKKTSVKFRAVICKLGNKAKINLQKK